MARRNYKFTNKHHPDQAILSLILGLISLAGIASVIYLSYREMGETHSRYGVTGLLALLFSLAGVVLGILSFRKRDSFRVLCWVGTLLNLMLLVGIGFLFSLGV